MTVVTCPAVTLKGRTTDSAGMETVPAVFVFPAMKRLRLGVVEIFCGNVNQKSVPLVSDDCTAAFVTVRLTTYEATPFKLAVTFVVPADTPVASP